MSKGFIKILREAQELFENDVDAFVVLMQMAFRARWKDSPYNKDGLALGESKIGVGDAIRLKLNEQRYRDAKERIEQKYKLATFKGTKRGTIAKLIDNRLCDLNIEFTSEQKNEQKNEQEIFEGTNRERTENEQSPTNKERKKERKQEPNEVSSNDDTYSPRRSSTARHFVFDYQKGEFQGITETDLQKWQRIYPHICLEISILAASDWILSNMSDAESRKIQRRYLTDWLKRDNITAMNRKPSQMNEQPKKTSLPFERNKRDAQEFHNFAKPYLTVNQTILITDAIFIFKGKKELRIPLAADNFQEQLNALKASLEPQFKQKIA